MDPLTLAALIALGASGAIGGTAGAVALYRAIIKAGFPKTTPAGEPITYERFSVKEMAKEMARRVVITHTLITVGREQTGKKAVGERVIRQEKTGERQVDEKVVGHRITGYQKVGEEKVGEKQVDERVVNHRWEESPVPADRVHLRPIRGLHEAHRRPASELLLPDDIQEMRMITGRAPVLVFQRRVPVMEPVMEDIMEDVLQPITEPVTEPIMEDIMVDVTETIWEPVYEPITRKRTHGVYLLIDYSNSTRTYLMDTTQGVVRGYPWRGKLSDQAAQRVFERCKEEGIPFFCRAFHHEAESLFSWRPGDPEDGLKTYFRRCDTGGTDIAHAIECAIHDLTAEGLDSADLMIHTDGEDQNLSSALRRRLDQVNVRMHVQLYGVENETLRRLAHTWSLCPTENYISQVVTNP